MRSCACKRSNICNSWYCGNDTGSTSCGLLGNGLVGPIFLATCANVCGAKVYPMLANPLSWNLFRFSIHGCNLHVRMCDFTSAKPGPVIWGLIVTVCEAVLLELCSGHSLLLSAAIRLRRQLRVHTARHAGRGVLRCCHPTQPDRAPAHRSPIRGGRLLPDRRPRRKTGTCRSKPTMAPAHRRLVALTAAAPSLIKERGPARVRILPANRCH
jgi:hypothetical protein